MANKDTVVQDEIFGNGHLENAEVVSIAESGQWRGDVLLPGVSMTWHQDDRPFGLLMSVQLLIDHGGGDVGSMAFYLRLAVDEPHAPAKDGGRLWFPDLPSGPY